MYDPKTVAHEIKVLGKHIVTIWHVDPATDGTDDSCGWSRPKLTDIEREKVNLYVVYEEKVIIGIYNKWRDSNRMPILYTLYQGLKWHLYREHLSSRDIRDLMGFAWNIHDDIMIYSERPKQEFRRLCFNLARHLKHAKRKRWQHPRWHFWHWEFQVHPIQSFKRWAFSRCYHCGERFAWGESPISLVWDGGGPQWFKSEPKILHQDCYPAYRKSDNDVQPTAMARRLTLGS